MSDEYKTVYDTCPMCGGTGFGAPIFIMFPIPQICYYCGGTGRVPKRVKVEKEDKK